jgi:hypothetical protein
MSRKYKTPAERLADAKAQAAKIEAQQIEKANDLLKKADGWVNRAAELEAKAEGARDQAKAALEAVGIDPDEFISELKSEEE